VITYSLQVNGRSRHVCGEPSENLLFVLRERCGLLAAKPGCEEGECGACSILVNGTVMNSCLVLAAGVGDAELSTPEYLAEARGADIAASLVRSGAVQCGFCTPGMVTSLTALMDETPVPTETDVRDAIAGNLCRCTGYGRLVAAVEGECGARTAGQ
jgi:carbon-monoxide dehydrogenase small subunit